MTLSVSSELWSISKSRQKKKKTEISTTFKLKSFRTPTSAQCLAPFGLCLPGHRRRSEWWLPTPFSRNTLGTIHVFFFVFGESLVKALNSLGSAVVWRVAAADVGSGVEPISHIAATGGAVASVAWPLGFLLLVVTKSPMVSMPVGHRR